jgi:hypothetical protein
VRSFLTWRVVYDEFASLVSNLRGVRISPFADRASSKGVPLTRGPPFESRTAVTGRADRSDEFADRIDWAAETRKGWRFSRGFFDRCQNVFYIPLAEILIAWPAAEVFVCLSPDRHLDPNCGRILDLLS